jgi:uncharacterized iron-regulated protein
MLTACAGRTPSPAAAPAAFTLPDNVAVVDGRTGARMAPAALVQRVRAADLVLLGEVHDNGVQHAMRGRLIAAAADVHPAIVFEQFAESSDPIAPPTAGETMEAWLDANGFDREGWKGPVHRPVVAAALEYGRSVWGSNVTRESLRSVVRDGESAAPAHLRSLLERVPLDAAGKASLDRDLVESHCGRLPESMIPGMRAAQTVRDAAMANALARAAADGPAWLIAGNGHVRADIAVPRLLRATQPNADVVAVGFLERDADGGEPSAASRMVFDIAVITPRVERPDPCAEFGGR